MCKGGNVCRDSSGVCRAGGVCIVRMVMVVNEKHFKTVPAYSH